ncbi:GNAT family N-acetyltransferase [Algiphilus aromaticivorans]|uniref:GNAT family N-acetyltransferase n=1 Tax=Algiphilus aromaticivorans TaxID=382454 RepID=UPI0005C25382|nr:GNAT family N-acetyltransferase [Algiphilus aromaticivorans]
MIEAVSDRNLEEVLPLIRAYQAFYAVADIDDERNRRFFSRFGEGSDEGCLFLYRAVEGNAVAFATVYFSYVSSVPARVGVMNDLYTDPAYRGRGIGRQLVDHCRDFALSKGAARLQWLTAIDNERAQKLYDAMNTKKSTWHVYTYTA